MAAAKDNLSDSWVSIGTAVGIFGSQFNLPWLDPLTAIVVGILICKTAWDIFQGASHQLTDGFDQDLMNSYKKSITQVKGVKDLRARSYVILVNSTLDIKDAHDISSKVERKLMEENNMYDVHVHVEPN